jgi:hypothetical protein
MDNRNFILGKILVQLIAVFQGRTYQVIQVNNGNTTFWLKISIHECSNDDRFEVCDEEEIEIINKYLNI